MGSSLTQAEAAALGIKLRESCDACLTAKVKCGKGRPMCNRCLTNGSECSYSPSARAGRKNRNSTGGVKKSGANTPAHKRPASIDIPKNSSLSSASTPWLSYPSSYDAGSQLLDKNIKNTANDTTAPNDATSTAPFYTTTTPPLTNEDEALEMNTRQHGMPFVSDSDDTMFNLIPTPPFHPNDFPHEFSQYDGTVAASNTITFPDLHLSPSSDRTHNCLNGDVWMGQDPLFGSLQPPVQGNLDTSFFELSSPIVPAPKSQAQQQVNGQTCAQQSQTTAEACDCFADCLQSLKDLHISSWSRVEVNQNVPQFDMVLSVNNAAINATSKMLVCTTCSTKGGIGIATMLMATIFGKVLSLYRNAIHNRFGSTAGSRDMQTPASLAFGAYEVSGDDRHLLEIEILLFELKKVEKSMSLWRDRSEHLSADKDVNSVYEALATYLDKNLHHVIDFLRQRRAEMCK